ncbi:MAG TPA: hypothetical protein VFM80_11615 [Gracilimonas sp.]|uniref:hypothetical protein n=1 Tax=Gracilimonas sp. TaxID=1974203 RepID=UPI002DB4C0A1|nr:hypothetical protein [Gracilimonas sp.]
MPRIFSVVVVFVLMLGISACSTSEEITTKSETSPGIYPSWYSTSGLASDSLSFRGYATAVSSDSVLAMANAELQARVNLESNIAHKMEAVREALEERGSSLATNTDFIITLRNAHNMVQNVARLENKSAEEEDGYYRGFAQVVISKTDLKSLLESGFSEKDDYWQTFSSSPEFSEEIE